MEGVLAAMAQYERLLGRLRQPAYTQERDRLREEILLTEMDLADPQVLEALRRKETVLADRFIYH